MNTLIQETLQAFQQRNELNFKDGFYQQKDLFNKTLLKSIQDRIDDLEYDLFLDCRKKMNEGLDFGRAGNLELAIEEFKPIETLIYHPKHSSLLKLLLATFYSSGLAYLRLKQSNPSEADALCLRSLALNNYLIQHHEIEVLELHRVQQIVNLARIKWIIGQRDAAFDLLFAIIRSFEHRTGFPACYQFNNMHCLQEQYPSEIPTPSPVGDYPLNRQFKHIFDTRVKRFEKGLEQEGLSAMESLFMLDFSALSFELIQRVFDDVIIELVSFTRAFSQKEVRAILQKYHFKTIDDLINYRKYETAYLFLAMKIHALNGEHTAFLKLLQSFCKKAAFQPIWKAVTSDFYHVCQSSGTIKTDVEKQVFYVIDR